MQNPEKLFALASEDEEQGRLGDALRHLHLASQLGHLDSQVTLGNFYAEGKGVPRDMAAARLWYERAYNGGSREAAYNLGIGLRKCGDLRGAVEWLRRAANLNDGDACVALAELSLNSKERYDLSRLALSLSADDITGEAREIAERMLASDSA